MLEALGREKRQLEQRCAATWRRLEQVRDEVEMVHAWNASLEENCASWEKQVVVVEEQMASVMEARGRWVPELEAKVGQLMLKLDGMHQQEQVSAQDDRVTSRL